MRIKIIEKQYYKGTPLWFNNFINEEFEAEWDDYWKREYKIITGEYKGYIIPCFCCKEIK